MNLVNICPDIPDDWRGTLCETARILGLDRKTLAKYAALGREKGGIAARKTRKGKRVFAGREIKRFWRDFI